MTSTDDKARAERRIAKLIALANNPGASSHEAQSAIRQAQTIAARYGVAVDERLTATAQSENQDAAPTGPTKEDDKPGPPPQPKPPTPRRARLSLGEGLPDITVCETVEAARGRVIYRIRGRRAEGAVTFTPYCSPDSAQSLGTTQYVRIEIGIGGVTQTVRDYTEPLTINQIVLWGARNVNAAEAVNESYYFRSLDRWCSNHRTAPAPPATNRYGGAILRALLHHWYRRTDRQALILAATGRQAIKNQQEASRRIQCLKNNILDLQKELSDAYNHLGDLQTLVAEYHQTYPPNK